MSNHPVPIKDIQFHEERLRDVADEAAEAMFGDCDPAAVNWHTTAIAYLEIGARYDLPGPAVEHESGRVELIEDYLVPTTDSHGQINFHPVLIPHAWDRENRKAG